MENTKLSPQLSICIPVLTESPDLATFAKDVKSFFEKYGVPYEVVMVTSKPSTNFKSLQKEIEIQNSRIRFINVDRKLSRGQSLHRALCEAQGDYLVTGSVDLNVPLGDLTKLIQQLMEDRSYSIIFGNRYQHKKSPFRSHMNSRKQLELQMRELFWAKKKSLLDDPFTDYFALSKVDQDLIQKTNPDRAWNLATLIEATAYRNNKKNREIAIFDSGCSGRSFNSLKERLLLLWRSL